MSNIIVPVNSVQSDKERKDKFFQTMQPKFMKLATVMSGSAALRKAGTEYTPRFSSETQAAYDDRLKKTHLTNILEDSILNVVARPFSEELTVVEAESNPEYHEWSKDIDREGTDINQFCREVFEVGTTYGLTFVMVDYPDIGGRTLTKGQAAQENVRPYFVHVKPMNVLAYREAGVGGKKQCVYFKYCVHSYDYDEDDNEVEVREIYEIKASTQHKLNSDGKIAREAQVGFYKVYRKEGSKTYVLDREGPYTFDAVSVVVFRTGKQDEIDNTIKPPFMDLCEANISHWNSSSDQNNILTRSRFAMYHFKGFKPNETENADGQVEIEQIELGPDSVFFSHPDDNAEIETVTLPTTGIEHGWTHLDRLIEEMRIMGLDPLISKASSSTATGDAITDEKSNSALETWALTFAAVIEQAFKFAGAWHNLSDPTKIKIQINTRFGVTNKEINEIKTFQHMHSMGQISLRTLLLECQARQMFRPEFDVDQEIKLVNEENEINFPDYDLTEGGKPQRPTHRQLPEDKLSEKYATPVNGPSIT